MKKIIKIQMLVFGLSLVLLVVVRLLIPKTFEIDASYFAEQKPLSFFTILNHNSKFIPLFMIPIFGAIAYCFNFLINFILIHFHIMRFGLLNTVPKLLHLPFEISGYSLCVAYSISRPIREQKNSMKLILIGSFALIMLAAYIESRL